MSFRIRIMLALLTAALVPLAVLALLVRHEMTSRLTEQYQAQIEQTISNIEMELSRQNRVAEAALESVRNAILADNRLRRAIVDEAETERRYLLDYAQTAMPLAGLSLLQLQAADGRILSSGHFRNDFDRFDPELIRLLDRAPESQFTVIDARTPEANFVAFARLLSFGFGDRMLYAVGGLRVDEAFVRSLSPQSTAIVSLLLPDQVVSSRADADTVSTTSIQRSIPLGYADVRNGELRDVSLVVSYPTTDLIALRRNLNRWFLLVIVVAVVLSVMAASWLTSRLARPIRELADKTAQIDYHRLGVDFSTRRNDEIGTLSRALQKMTRRLRASSTAIRDAERRATLGELARQINHDIKNGLAPIRNVFRHLVQVSREAPSDVQEVFEERKRTIDSSLSYLENLAANYGRISRGGRSEIVDVNQIVQQVAEDFRVAPNANIVVIVENSPRVDGDPVTLRRILENLTSNAVDSLQGRPGTVTLATTVLREGTDRPSVRITVKDTGTGMTEDEMSKAFEDFFTTKDLGTGLGLSIVRRLVIDFNGSYDLASTKGEGTVVTIDLPLGGG